MKKRVCYILLFCCMLSFMPCHAEGPAESVEQAREQLQQLNIINEDSFSQEEIVYRCEAIVPIMKVYGLPESYEDGDNLGTCLQPFSDVAKDRWNDENSPKNQYGIKVHYFGYVMAGEVLSIVYGYRNGYFGSYDAITAKEAAAFMMRCIEGLEIYVDGVYKINDNIDISYINAKNCGLVQETDRFYEDGDLALTRDELCILLDRMLYQPCCKCYIKKEVEPGIFEESPWVDKERTKRYIDILNGDFPESGDKSLW